MKHVPYIGEMKIAYKILTGKYESPRRCKDVDWIQDRKL
jgi:hypothetical protein